jgi:filamentous hemagglutinin
VTPPHTDVVRPSALLKGRGAKWYDYVVKENGELVMGERIPGQGHANLAEGQPVRAAGQVQVSGGRIVEIDNASGHYLPKGPNARNAALEAFRENFKEVPGQVYVEKFFNEATKLWEAVK